MYIKYLDYSGETLSSEDCVLMSAKEFEEGGKNLMGVPVTITPDGSEPKNIEIEGELL